MFLKKPSLMEWILCLSLIGTFTSSYVAYHWGDTFGRDMNDRGRTAEKTAVPTAQYPLAGFWKVDGCQDDFGMAITPASDKAYFISFCGPGGCFKPGSYIPETPLHGDRHYRVINSDTIDFFDDKGTSQRYVRCPKRETL